MWGRCRALAQKQSAFSMVGGDWPPLSDFPSQLLVPADSTMVAMTSATITAKMWQVQKEEEEEEAEERTRKWGGENKCGKVLV